MLVTLSDDDDDDDEDDEEVPDCSVEPQSCKEVEPVPFVD